MAGTAAAPCRTRFCRLLRNSAPCSRVIAPGWGANCAIFSIICWEGTEAAGSTLGAASAAWARVAAAGRVGTTYDFSRGRAGSCWPAAAASSSGSAGAATGGGSGVAAVISGWPRVPRKAEYPTIPAPTTINRRIAA